MSNTTGYIAIALVGGAMISLIFGGMYYANSLDNKLTPTGMSAYQQVTPHFGGKTRKRNRNKNRRTFRKGGS